MLKKILPISAFSRNIITLITGTSIAQAIPIAISPILTRLYSPEQFGIFSFYIAITAIISIAVTGRYELAILLPKKDNDAINITVLSIGLSLLISSILLVLILAFNGRITTFLGEPAISSWLYLVPLSTFISGIYQSLNYWSNRKQHYKRIAISRMVQNGSSSAGQLGGGYISIGAIGLVAGQLFGQIFSTIALARLIQQEDQLFLKKVKYNKIIALAKKYFSFPKYLILAHGLNTASSQMPAIMLTTLFNSASAGFYTLTQRVFGAPMALIAGAISDVFRQEASHAYAHTGNCKAIYKKTFKRLLTISFLPFVIFFFFAPELFSLVFGEEWRISGEYAKILTPMFFLRFITSPLSAMFMIAEKQKFDLYWQIILFILVGSSFIIGSAQSNIHLSLVIFCASYCVMYIVNCIISYRLSFGNLK